MNVRLGNTRGFNLTLVSHWTYEEQIEEPPPPANGEGLDKPDGTPPLGEDVQHGTLPVFPEEGEGETQSRDAALGRDPTVPPPSSAAPDVLYATAREPEVAPHCAKTLTLYFSGLAEPVVLTDDEAAAVLGVLVSDSGSLT